MCVWGGGGGNQRRYGVLKNALEQEMGAGGGRGRGSGGFYRTRR